MLGACSRIAKGEEPGRAVKTTPTPVEEGKESTKVARATVGIPESTRSSLATNNRREGNRIPMTSTNGVARRIGTNNSREGSATISTTHTATAARDTGSGKVGTEGVWRGVRGKGPMWGEGS